MCQVELDPVLFDLEIFLVLETLDALSPAITTNIYQLVMQVSYFKILFCFKKLIF